MISINCHPCRLLSSILKSRCGYVLGSEMVLYQPFINPDGRHFITSFGCLLCFASFQRNDRYWLTSFGSDGRHFITSCCCDDRYLMASSRREVRLIESTLGATGAI